MLDFTAYICIFLAHAGKDHIQESKKNIDSLGKQDLLLDI